MDPGVHLVLECAPFKMFGRQGLFLIWNGRLVKLYTAGPPMSGGICAVQENTVQKLIWNLSLSLCGGPVI